MLIVCEGKETEPRYFRALWQRLRIKTVHVEVTHEKGGPVAAVEEAVRLRDERLREAGAGEWAVAYDQVWVVLDVEQVDMNPHLTEALTLAKRESVKIAASNPAFEYWYLLHFVHTASPFHNARAVIRDLKKDLPGYSKSADVFPTLYPKTHTAMTNAERVIREHWPSEDDITKCNPRTDVHLLVKELHDIAEKPWESPP